MKQVQQIQPPLHWRRTQDTSMHKVVCAKIAHSKVVFFINYFFIGTYYLQVAAANSEK